VRLRSGQRQKNQPAQGELAFPVESRSDAPKATGKGTETLVGKHQTESLAGTERLMEEVCELENCKQALQRVKANKGSPGIDGMTVEELPEYLKQHGLTIGEQLRHGTYQPQPVRRVEIEKPEGGGMRKLGIPTVIANCTIGQLTFGMGRDPASIPSALGAAVSRTQDTTRSRR
jgi:RNA-directed DNA polymerase